ncbi:putative calcineurin-like phosphoesterase domain, ApaH type, metallo-dependent phosphatase [Helianthus annuus]|nr:putative calcineurin-like phosphoesterase domain, ApaH type, metallo-dependent phosphatase [Helianthus annuus]
MISNLSVFLCVIWAITLLYGEKFAFYWTCSWPIETTDNPADYVKIAVVTDPQLMDRTSLNLAPKSLALEIVQFYTDIFMRRAMLASVMPLKPDMVLFLGDYFDGGPVLSDEEWQDSLNRFRHIFDIKTLERVTNNRVYFLSGNHDIGYAAYHSHKPDVISRYEKVFGSRNYHFGAGEVEFVAVDAQTLDGHPLQSQTSASWTFVNNVSRDSLSPPRVLLTHIPLYRPDWTSCGSKRSSPIINQRISRVNGDHEIMYQNYLTEETSNKLLDFIKPVLVLSGHDHDQCTVTHRAKHGAVVEHTLGTISWQQGNLYPSFMLLTASKLSVSNASNAVSTRLCLLPAQIFIYIWYILLFVVTLVVILVWPTNGLNIHLHIGENMRNILGFFKSNAKEKDEDENCEYEMVWDAEGSMHLIKKPKKIVPPHSTERVERGNATLRSAAKKQTVQEVNLVMPQDASGQPGPDAGARLGQVKANKSTVRFVIRRLVRVFQVLSVVAAVNVPIYIMLLFADWIDK